MARDPYRYFRIEARELLDQMGKDALELETNPNAEALSRLLRHAHTLKGAARVVKQREMAERVHAIEETLSPFRDAPTTLASEQVSVLLALLDEVSAALALLSPPPAAPSPAAPTPAPAEARALSAPRALHADAAELENLLEEVTEAYVHVGSLRRGLMGIERAQRLLEGLVEQVGGGLARATAEELRTVLGRTERHFGGAVDRIERELRQVRDNCERLRLVPVETLFSSLQRTARDAAQELGKRVQLSASGGEVRLDADVLNTAQPALIQAVRNAIAHGIEKPEERQAAGKAPDGRIAFDVRRRGGQVTFCCYDDGRGVDLEAVRRIAERRGRISPQTSPSASSLLQLLTEGGLSTSGEVTEMAGRGIGMDVIREASQRLGGEVRIESEAGQSTSLTLSVPVSLASLEALTVRAGSNPCHLPLEAVRHTMRVSPSQITRTAQGESVLFERQVVSVYSLAHLLFPQAHPASPTDHDTSLVLIAVGDRQTLMALRVEGLLGTANIVLRPLPELAYASRAVAGAAFNAEGDPQLVLDPEGLLAESMRGAGVTVATRAVRKPILVIDDSLTTRTLEQSILESAGFEVDLACSGEEGLEMARKREYALFLVDVEMPGMDGFTFIEHTQRDETLKRIPSILVTSLSAPEHKSRGAAVGARGYVVKSEFDQKELLERIQNLV